MVDTGTRVVVSLKGSDCEVKLLDGGVTTLPAEDLEAVNPQKNSSVIILQVCVCVRERERERVSVCVLYVTSLQEEDLEAAKPQKNFSIIILSLLSLSLSPSHPPSIPCLHSVIILQGELKGNTGKLIGIDGCDGIVKMDMNQDIKVVDMPFLAVYRRD